MMIRSWRAIGNRYQVEARLQIQTALGIAPTAAHRASSSDYAATLRSDF
jgi:hypothetical protein